MTCKRCGGELTTQAAQMIGVCTACIQASYAPIMSPKPPAYTWNTQKRDEPTEPPPLASFD